MFLSPTYSDSRMVHSTNARSFDNIFGIAVGQNILATSSGSSIV